MNSLRSGQLPEWFAVACVRGTFCMVFLTLGACASRQAQHQTGPQFAVAPQSARVAGYREVAGPVEIEDDGIEAQAAPPRRLKNEPDNPFEPYSPNYGSFPAAMGDGVGDDDETDTAPDAFDPFLDGPQWDREYGDGSGAGDDDGLQGTTGRQVRSPNTRPVPTRLKAGFRRKRVSVAPRLSHSPAMYESLYTSR